MTFIIERKINNMNYDAEVVRQYQEGKSVAEISRNTGLSRQGIYNILNRKQINYKKVNKEVDVDAIKKDLQRNKIKSVMKKYGISYHFVRKLMDKNNIDKSEIMKDVLKKEDVERLYTEMGMSDEEIGRIFNCSQYTVRSFRWEHGIYNKNRNWHTILTKEMFLKMQDDGLSLRAIAEKTGIPYHTIVKANKLYNNEDSEG